MSGNGPSGGWDRQGEPAQPVPPAPASPPEYAVAKANGLAIAALVCGISLDGRARLDPGPRGRLHGVGPDRPLRRTGRRAWARRTGIVLGWVGVAAFLLLVLGMGCAVSSGRGGEFGEPIIIEP